MNATFLAIGDRYVNLGQVAFMKFDPFDQTYSLWFVDGQVMKLLPEESERLGAWLRARVMDPRNAKMVAI